MAPHRFAFLLAAAVLTASCELIEPKDPGPVRDPDLIGPDWQLHAILTDGSVDADLDDRIYSIQFQSRGHLVFIRSDCNHCSGHFERGPDGALDISVQTCTEAACPPGTRTDEYVEHLREVHSYEINGRRLRLFFGEEGNALLHFARPR